MLINYKNGAIQHEGTYHSKMRNLVKGHIAKNLLHKFAGHIKQIQSISTAIQHQVFARFTHVHA